MYVHLVSSNSVYILHTGVSLSPSTAVAPKQLSDEGVQKVIEEVTSRERNV